MSCKAAYKPSGVHIFKTRDQKCNKCGKNKDSMSKCAGCGAAFYCCKECQKENWKVHKKFCKKGRN